MNRYLGSVPVCMGSFPLRKPTRAFVSPSLHVLTVFWFQANEGLDHVKHQSWSYWAHMNSLTPAALPSKDFLCHSLLYVYFDFGTGVEPAASGQSYWFSCVHVHVHLRPYTLVYNQLSVHSLAL